MMDSRSGRSFFFAFSPARDSGLGARNPANPYYSVPFAPSFILFSPARGAGLGARNPANPYYSVPFAPSFILFSPPRGSGLGARSPANPYCSVPFAPSFILFSPPRGSGLGARSPANPYYSVPFAPSPAHFSLLRSAGGRLPAARGVVYICICTQIICSILCTWLIFYCIPQILEYNIVYQNNRTTRRDRRSSEGCELLRGFKKIY